MVIVLVIVVLIMAAMVTTKLTTLVTSAGTFVLGKFDGRRFPMQGNMLTLSIFQVCLG